jgi:hypothetical protein
MKQMATDKRRFMPPEYLGRGRGRALGIRFGFKTQCHLSTWVGGSGEGENSIGRHSSYTKLCKMHVKNGKYR